MFGKDSSSGVIRCREIIWKQTYRPCRKSQIQVLLCTEFLFNACVCKRTDIHLGSVLSANCIWTWKNKTFNITFCPLKIFFLELLKLILNASFHGWLINWTSKNSVLKTILQEIRGRDSCRSSDPYFQVVFNHSHEWIIKPGILILCSSETF